MITDLYNDYWHRVVYKCMYDVCVWVCQNHWALYKYIIPIVKFVEGKYFFAYRLIKVLLITEKIEHYIGTMVIFYGHHLSIPSINAQVILPFQYEYCKEGC
jgi:hypothetical protein